MKPVAAVNALLSANADLIAQVPAARIFSGPIPQETTLPAIAVTLVSNVRRENVAGTGSKLSRARVQVTVHATSYSSLQTIRDLVVAALPRSRGTTAGVSIDSIIPGDDGPDMADEESGIFLGSPDFMVVYIE